ncbi:MAG: hydroxypyruvate isomerase [Dehalococcoidales bacterium]|jgi:hydroxypyruvate isomerase|nr:hydroxypyruvate isomerase [Dehalococcoidales bacterium]
MPKFSANLSMLFTEVGFADRFERSARAGFKAVECQFPYELPKEDIAERLGKYGLELVLYNIPAGSWAAGERGTACLPGRESEFQEGVGKAIEYAKALKCPRINCLVGLTPKDAPADKVRQTLVSNLKFAAEAMQKAGISLLVEMLNDKDVPGFYLVRTQDTLKLFEEVKHANLWLQYDIYHMQVMEGNLAKTIQENVSRIGHIQLADNPGRHEPGTGEINFTNLFKFIDESGYTGWIGCEYKPAGATEDGLGWVKPYL